MKIHIVLATLVLGITAGWTPEAVAQRAISQTVQANKETRLGSTALIGRNCEALSNSMKVTRQPKNGTVSLKIESHTIRSNSNRVNKCKGRKTKGVAVYYKPASGFTGRDSFTISRTENGRAFPQRFKINVQ